MMGWTDRHARYFLRLISKRTLLYTEMVTTGAILHGQRNDLLKYHPVEHPLALQLGGSEPAELAECARIAQTLDFDEVNLNVGCPSDRVQSGRFGACLMAEPDLVAECVAAMQVEVDIPVTVKCRVGIDHMEGYEPLDRFITSISTTGCTTFIIHARKAWLQGLSPKENREIPPLQYALVHQLKKQHPDLCIVVNGGIRSAEDVQIQLKQVDGVMLGREAYHNPFVLAEIDAALGVTQSVPDKHAIAEAMLQYIDTELASGTRLHSITRHLYGLFHGQPGAKAWRRHLSMHSNKPDASAGVVRDAIEYVE